MTPARHHPYVSHLVRVAPRSAGVGLDFARASLGGSHDDGAWTVTTPAGTLRLGVATPYRRVVPVPRGYRPLRIATGTLHPAPTLRTVRVSLELLPWSSRWSELALVSMPLGVFDSRARAERAYLRAAHATLDRLVRAIETPPAEWLARLVADQPVPSSEDVAVVDRLRPGREG